MAKYIYPAIFTPEKDGGYSINFPDLEGCYTYGDDLADGMEMAKDDAYEYIRGIYDYFDHCVINCNHSKYEK